MNDDIKVMIQEISKRKKETSSFQKKVAKRIFYEMKDLTEKWETCDEDLDVSCHWGGYVSVDGIDYSEESFIE